MKRCNSCFQLFQEQQDVCPHCGHYEGKPADELYHLFPGTILEDRYVVGKVLGFGGFGITYKAWDMKLETIVAIKEFYPSGLVNRVPGEKEVILFATNKIREYNFGLTRFLDEAKNMAKFGSHKNIVNVFEYFEANNSAYIVMEYLDGISLSSFMKFNKLDIDDCLEITMSICEALKKIHSLGIIHRDVSPDNIYMCLNGNIKLIDFGAARFAAGEEKQMTIILKPGFAPPEQYEKISAQGPWTDIYALGATLYYLLTGEKPEESTNRKINDTLIEPKLINTEISENINNTVMKAMAIEKHLRFAKVEEFEKALKGDIKVTTIDNEKRRKKRIRLGGIAAAVAVVMISASVLMMNLLKQKEAETLPDASIAVMYELCGNKEIDTAKEKALNSITSVFTESFSNVTIELLGVNAEEYSDVLKNGKTEAGNSVVVFESGNSNESLINEYATRVSEEVIENGKVNAYSYSENGDSFLNKKQVALGFVVPVVYSNKNLTDYNESSVKSINDLLKNIGESKGIAIHNDAKDMVLSAFGKKDLKNKKINYVDSADGFISGEYAFYITTSVEYSIIQSNFPAQYNMFSVGADDVYVEYSELFSVVKGLSSDEVKVANAFIEFMLNENAQDYLYVQNWSGHLPLNKATLDVVEYVYTDFDNFFSNIDQYIFE